VRPVIVSNDDTCETPETMEPGKMPIFALRMKNGNCVVAAAENETVARERAKDIGRDIEIASVRELSFFAAQFTLTDEGELVSILLDRQTLSDLLGHEYPMLYAARSHSYEDFGPSPTNAASAPALYNGDVRTDRLEWDLRDKNMISFVVQQERERLAN
jgi:hypothetical protein